MITLAPYALVIISLYEVFSIHFYTVSQIALFSDQQKWVVNLDIP